MGRLNGFSESSCLKTGWQCGKNRSTLCHAMLDTLLQNRYRFMRRGCRDWKNLCLPDRLYFTEKVCPAWACRFPAGGGFHLQRCPAWACRFPAGGGFHLQRCPAGRYHRGIHSIFVPDFSGEPHHSKAHPGDGAKGQGTLCLRRPPFPAFGSGER